MFPEARYTVLVLRRTWSNPRQATTKLSIILPRLVWKNPQARFQLSRQATRRRRNNDFARIAGICATRFRAKDEGVPSSIEKMLYSSKSSSTSMPA